MEKIFFNWFGNVGYFLVPIITALMTSFGIEAVNQYTPNNVTPKWINFILTLLFSILIIFIFKNVYYTNVFDYMFIFITNISFSTVFYYIVGRRVVIKIITAIEKRIEKEVDEKIGKGESE